MTRSDSRSFRRSYARTPGRSKPRTRVGYPTWSGLARYAATGAEVNVRPDGSLDLPRGALGKLDFVGAAIHTHFDQSRDEGTQRLIRALEKRSLPPVTGSPG